jgi:hypothetical protein
MGILAFIGPVCGLLCLLGLRVLSLSRRAGGPTEALVGLAFLCMGLGGIPGLLAGRGDLIEAEWAVSAFVLGQTAIGLAFSALFVFAWRCFGPTTSWRRTLALLGVASQALVLVALGVFEGFRPPGGDVLRVAVLVRSVAIAWAFAESIHYWRIMLRRQALGLVDPVVTNRFLLWGLWTGGLLAMTLVIIAVRLLDPNIELDPSRPAHALILVSTLCCVLTSCVGLGLAFFPPAFYVERIRRRAEAGSA